MFKNFVIVLLAVSTLTFGWLAVRNAGFRTCDELIRVKAGMICQTNLGDVEEDEALDALKRLHEMDGVW